jgi:pimeloyl-ACP methyl ester carboxylesterase
VYAAAPCQDPCVPLVRRRKEVEMAQEESPTVVLVHGAWHGPWAWSEVEGQLADLGVDVVTVDLPSVGEDTSALGGLEDDAAAIRAAIDAVDGQVVVVAHSYGGAPTTQGAAGAENVTHIVYVTAFMLDEGESLFGLVGGVAPDWWVVAEDGESLMPGTPVETFFNDVSPEEADAAAARLAPQSMAAVKTPVSAVAWRDVPTTYVICEQDQAIPVPAQEMLSGRAGAVRRLDASHSPFLSRPGEVVEIIRGVL